MSAVSTPSARLARAAPCQPPVSEARRRITGATARRAAPAGRGRSGRPGCRATVSASGDDERRSGGFCRLASALSSAAPNSAGARPRPRTVAPKKTSAASQEHDGAPGHRADAAVGGGGGDALGDDRQRRGRPRTPAEHQREVARPHPERRAERVARRGIAEGERRSRRRSARDRMSLRPARRHRRATAPWRRRPRSAASRGRSGRRASWPSASGVAWSAGTGAVPSSAKRSPTVGSATARLQRRRRAWPSTSGGVPAGA